MGMWQVKKPNDNSIQCSLIKSPTIFIEQIPRQKIEYLMEEYSHQEWLAYLVGSISEKENFFVEDISVPPHKEASGGSAEAEPFHVPNNCIGIIHSHHSMGAFHSATDQAYVDKNYLVSITVARKVQTLEYDAISYQLTPCGKGTTSKCEVKYVQAKPLFNKEKFLEQVKENIDKGKKVSITWQNNWKKFFRSGSVLDKIPGGYQEGEVWTDGHGIVLTEKEITDIMKDIYGD